MTCRYHLAWIHAALGSYGRIAAVTCRMIPCGESSTFKGVDSCLAPPRNVRPWADSTLEEERIMARLGPLSLCTLITVFGAAFLPHGLPAAGLTRTAARFRIEYATYLGGPALDQAR